MFSSSLFRTLRRVVRRESRANRDHRQSLEKDLLARYRAIYSPRVDELPTRRNLLLRTAWAVVILLVVVGVPAIPATYPVHVGSFVIWEIPGLADTLSVSETLRFLESKGVAEEVSVSVSENSGRGDQLFLVLLGEHAATDRVVDLLRERYPEIENASVRSEELVGYISTFLAARVGRALFSIEVNADDMEEARRQVLSGLASRGFPGSTVEIVPTEGGREIRVDLEPEE